MRKIILILIIGLFMSAGLFAAGPQYFAFEIGAGGAFDIDTSDILASKSFGFNYRFNESFYGGFEFMDINGIDIDVVNIGYSPAENMMINMYTGQVGASFGFGAGFGYDFFTNNAAFFTSLGLYVDWFGGSGVDYNIEDGGILTFGLKTRLGL